MSDPHRDLDDLLGRLRDGALDDSAAAELEQLILDDPAAMDRFIHHRWIDSGLTERFGEPRSLPLTGRASTTASVAPSRRIAPLALSLAAAVLLAAAIVVVYLATTADRPATVAPVSEGAPVALLLDATGDVLVNNDLANPGNDYRRGVYSIEAGEADLLLTSRVGVKMAGRTSMTLHSNMIARVAHGSARFSCPPGAEGFTVRLPDDSEVVDLGTAFGVDVDADKRTRLTVTEGRVLVRARHEAAPVEVHVDGVVTIADGRVEWVSDRTLALTPVADAYVNRQKPDESFGAEQRIIANEWPDSGPRWTYLRFDLVGVVDPITAASLELTTETGQSHPDRYQVFGLVGDAAWHESGEQALTWTNAPARAGDRVDPAAVHAGAPVAEFETTSGRGSIATAFDVSSGAVVELLNAHRGKTVTLVIAESSDRPSGTGDAWYSRETKTPPKLTLKTLSPAHIRPEIEEDADTKETVR